MSQLVGQEVPVCCPELQTEANATSAGWKASEGMDFTEPKGPLLEAGITAAWRWNQGDATMAGD